MGQVETKQPAILITHVATRNNPLTKPHIDSVTADVEIVARVDVRPPLRDELDEFDEHYPWDDAMGAQATAHAQLRSCVESNPETRVIYMGFAPIPLVFHFGRLLGDHISVEIFQHHKRSKSWLWPSDVPTPELLAPLSLPQSDHASTRDVLLRVECSYPITAHDVVWVSNSNMQECGLELTQPQPNAIHSLPDLRNFARGFRDLIDGAHRRFPSAPMRHLVASVPVAAALVMGMELNPTIHLPIQTWQYLRNRRQRYVKAALLSDFVDLPKALLLAASPVGKTAISAAQEIQQLGDLLLLHRQRLDLAMRPAAGIDSLTTLLGKENPTVLHIACHGEGITSGMLRLVAADGWSCTVEAPDLLRLLKRAPRLRCVVLMACESAELARQISVQVGCAIGWKGGLPDSEGPTFSDRLWRSLIDGHSIKEAFLDARLVLIGDREQVVLAVDGVDASEVVPFPRST
jgi:hypothetical protein